MTRVLGRLLGRLIRWERGAGLLMVWQELRWAYQRTLDRYFLFPSYFAHLCCRKAAWEYIARHIRTSPAWDGSTWWVNRHILTGRKRARPIR